MEIKGVIFDNDGVITDSEGYCLTVTKEIFKEKNIEWDQKWYLRLIGVTHQAGIQIAIDKFHDEKFSNELMDGMSERINEGIKNGKVPLKKGAIELINFLNENNIPICLATSGTPLKVKMSFNSNGYEVPFKNIITGDMVTHSKPHPEIFLKAAEKMQLDIKNCLIIEDSYKGIQAAINAGGISCMVPDLLEPTQENIETVDFIKKDLFEVQLLLKEILGL